jgi:hypothetical protein
MQKYQKKTEPGGSFFVCSYALLLLAFQSGLIGVCYYLWDVKDNPDDYTINYLLTNWDTEDTYIIIMCSLAGLLLLIIALCTRCVQKLS